MFQFKLNFIAEYFCPKLLAELVRFAYICYILYIGTSFECDTICTYIHNCVVVNK